VKKIISKTPLRISFVGDGTDLPSFYQKYGGVLISTAIDKYVTVTVSPRRDMKICISSPACPDGIGEGVQTVTSVDQIDHPIVRESLRKIGVGLGINIDIASDVAPGSGLGCSSALTVGLLNALRAYYAAQQQIEPDSNPRYTTNPLYTWTLAREACEIVINRLGYPIGKQDPHIAAYGGFRRFTFESEGDVGIDSIKPPDGLECVLMLFDIPMAEHEANKILPAQNRVASPHTLLKMKGQCGQLYSLLRGGDVTGIGYLLHEAWKLKKSLAPSICSDRLDAIYRLALDAGALGGKGLGAGGGGHFLLLAPLKAQKAIVKALDGLATRVPFKFEPKGSRLV
jgi:D-glycero-alpha-D-manno-heptose-7-phosphate kinase